MKHHSTLFLVVLVVLAILWPAQLVRSQDTLVVPWSKDGINPTIDTLRSVIMGDTLANGSRANMNRVYKLQKGGLYWLANRIENSQKGNTFPLRIVGEPAGTTFMENPPYIQNVLTASGGNPDGRMFTGLTDVTFKNLYITGRWSTGAQTSNYQFITMTANNSTFIIDNCIFEQSNFAPIAFTGSGNRITYTNNKFRNLVERPITQQWTGRGISIWADQDSVIVENNTFFNTGCFVLQIEGGAAKYVRFNHNTVVECGRQLVQGNWWQNAYIANNLIINGFWQGEGTSDLTATGRDPRQTHNGLFTIGPLPSVYGVPNEARRIVVAKNYAYLDPRFTTLYTADGVQRAYFLDPISKLDFSNLYTVAGGNHMYVRDTVWLSSYPAGMFDPLNDVNWQKPQYTTSTGSMLDSMWACIRTLRANLTPGAQFVYKQNSAWTDYTWPLPENFAYTEASMMTAGTDGLPIGDLNWFPTSMAAFLADKAVKVKSVENLAGQVIVTTLDSTIQAENTTLTTPAAIKSTQGLTYFEYNGSGSITWTVNITNAGKYDTKWLVHETGRGQSGPCLAIDGQTFVDRAHGWGQFVMDPLLGPAAGQPNNDWIWVPIVADSVMVTSPWGDSLATQTLFTLTAGTHTIGVVGGGWGTVRFAEIQMVKRGTTDTIKLKAPDAVPVLVTPGAVGVTWVAAGFKFVEMGTNGGITFTVKPKVAGNYHLRAFGQNLSGSGATLTVKEGATVITSPVMPFKTKPGGSIPDSTGNDVYSGVFALTAGDHVFTLSGSGVNIDYVQLIKEEVVAGVNPGEQPFSFALDQNYPNPFNPTTTINFSLMKTSNVTLTVFNILGQRVATLVNGQLSAGEHTVSFNAVNLATGVYLYRLEAGQYVAIKKMMLLK
jgi:hypothetical protein